MSDLPAPVWNFSDFERFVPPTGWIRDYLAYAVRMTDAPPLYHILSATAVVSAAVAPYIDLVHQGELHPLHLYMLVVGDSSESRKTSSIKRVSRVADPVFAKASHFGQRLWWPGTSSPEGFMEELAKEPNRLLFLSEWTEMHRLTGAGYWQHAGEFWNLIYDAHDMTRVLAKAKTTIKRPRVSILGASTPSLVMDATTRVDWLGGKLARYLIGCMTRPPDAEMDAASDDPMVVRGLQETLGQLVTPRPPGNNMALAPEAWSMMRAWQRDPWWRDLKARAPGHLRPSFGRASEHVFRTAAVFECSMTYPWRTTVGVESMTAAIALVEWCYETLIKTFPVLSHDDLSPLAKTVAILAAAGQDGMTRKELLRVTGMTAKQLAECLATINERGELNPSKQRWTGQHHVNVLVYTPPTAE